MTADRPAPDGPALLEEARQCLKRAYAPYSNFPVAAAVMDEQGRVFTGVNVENVSYGLTMCAERVAIFSAIAAGARQIDAVAVTAEKMKPILPCGACRQVMAEFCAPDTPVFLDTGTADHRTTTVGDLLPETFLPDSLGRSRP